MQRRSRTILVTAVGVVAVLALGVAGALVGRSFAAPADEDSAIPAPRTLADVVAPVAEGTDPPPVEQGRRLAGGELLGTESVPEPDETSASGDDEGVDEGTSSAQRRLLADAALPPGTPSDASLAAALSGATPEPGTSSPGSTSSATATPTESDAPAEPAEERPSGDSLGVRIVDPCAPDGDAPPIDAGCPDGLRSVVVADFALEPLEPIAQAEPLAREDWPAGVPAFLSCPREETGAGEIRFGVTASTPGTATITVEPADGARAAPPGTQRTFTITATPEQVAAWGADFEPDGRVELEARPHLCTTLSGLGDSTSWRYSVSYADTFGRTAAAPGGYFRVASRSAVPQPTVLPLGSSQAFVSAPHTGSTNVAISIFTGMGHDEPCPLPSSERIRNRALRLGTLTNDTYPVSPSYLAERGFDSEYTRVSTARFAVPPGSDVLVCLLTYDDERSAAVGPRSVTSLRLRAPGAALPSATLESVHLAGRVAEGSLVVRSYRGTGPVAVRCGGWSGPNPGVDVRALDWTLCGPPDDRYGSSWSVAGPVIDQPLVVRTAVTRDGRTFTKSTVLSGAKARRCTERGCVVPASATYEVPLPTGPVPSGLCGSSFGPCDPPTTERSLGVARIRVDWSTPAAGSPGRWEVSAPVTGRPERSATPVLDWLVEPTIERGGTAGPRLRADLEADRPVNWSVTLTGCDRPGTNRTLTATSRPSFRIAFDDLCPATDHLLEATLTDPTTGASSTWNSTTAPYTSGWWPGASVRVPADRIPVAVYLVAGAPTGEVAGVIGRGLWATDAGEVLVDGPWAGRPREVNWADSPERVSYERTQSCDTLALDPRTGLRGHRWESFTSLEVGAAPLPVSGSAQLFLANGTTRACTVNYDVFRMLESEVSGTVSGEQLRSPGDEVRISSGPEAEFPLTLIIRRTPGS